MKYYLMTILVGNDNPIQQGIAIHEFLIARKDYVEAREAVLNSFGHSATVISSVQLSSKEEFNRAKKLMDKLSSMKQLDKESN